MGVPKISNVRVLLETASGASEPSKVICVSWELVDEKQKIEGEWMVEWDDMYAELSEDVRSARSEQGGYFALQQEQERASEQYDSKAQYDEPLPTGPLSTARLLEFENGPNFCEVVEDLPAFFSGRPIVQTPTQILSDPTSVSKKTEVLFLLAPSTPIPPSIKIFFTPTWNPPNTPPAGLAEVKVVDYTPGEGLHTAWATRRLEDLKVLQEIANELEREGSRGTGQGRLKVGVEGGGMDEEAVRREGWMVGEEQVWVTDKFLTSHTPKQTSAPDSDPVMDPFAGLGISTGLSFAPGSSVLPRERQEEEEEEEEEDLFALPLSPRSPDMAVSPFSMFRGEALGTKPIHPSKLRNVESIDTSVMKSFSNDVTPTTSDVTPTAKRAAGAPPTPPREA